MHWQLPHSKLDLRSRGLLMGVLNITPDSFSDGGLFFHPDDAVEQGLRMEAEGAEILDVGGESTRPGSVPVPVEEELARVIPVIRGLRQASRVWISIDTTKAAVAAAALDAGADIVNDVSALRHDPEMLPLVANSHCGVVLMHMRGTPQTMQNSPVYEDVTCEVSTFLKGRLDACIEAGIDPERLVFDPGIGFGKTVDHNLQLLRNLPDISPAGRPLLIGVSRKSFLGALTGISDPALRLWPTVVLTAWTRHAGARIFRVHDVKENADALRMTEAIGNFGEFEKRREAA